MMLLPHRCDLRTIPNRVLLGTLKKKNIILFPLRGGHKVAKYSSNIKLSNHFNFHVDKIKETMKLMDEIMV